MNDFAFVWIGVGIQMSRLIVGAKDGHVLI